MTRHALAAATCLLAVVGVASPARAVEYNTNRTVVQPGAWVVSVQDDERCTAGFLVRDARGAVYAIEASYCAPDYTGDGKAFVRHHFLGVRSWPMGNGPRVDGFTPDRTQIGSFVLQVVPDNATDPSYALVQLRRGVPYAGTVAVVGGPARHAYTGETDQPTDVRWVCGDRWNDFAPKEQTYDSGEHDDIAPNGLRRGRFEIVGPVNGDCQGGPVVALDGNVPVGFINGNTAQNPSVETTEDRRVPTAPVQRLDATLRDAEKQLGRALTLIPAGVGGRAL